MSLVPVSVHEELEERLKGAGLRADPKTVIGRFYIICCGDGPSHVTLVGTITAIQLPAGEGVELYVSSSTLRRGKLDCVYFAEGTWKARTISEPVGEQRDSTEEVQFSLL